MNNLPPRMTPAICAETLALSRFVTLTMLFPPLGLLFSLLLFSTGMHRLTQGHRSEIIGSALFGVLLSVLAVKVPYVNLVFGALCVLMTLNKLAFLLKHGRHIWRGLVLHFYMLLASVLSIGLWVYISQNTTIQMQIFSHFDLHNPEVVRPLVLSVLCWFALSVLTGKMVQAAWVKEYTAFNYVAGHWRLHSFKLYLAFAAPPILVLMLLPSIKLGTMGLFGHLSGIADYLDNVVDGTGEHIIKSQR